jgi:hypothetical protein
MSCQRAKGIPSGKAGIHIEGYPKSLDSGSEGIPLELSPE